MRLQASMRQQCCAMPAWCEGSLAGQQRAPVPRACLQAMVHEVVGIAANRVDLRHVPGIKPEFAEAVLSAQQVRGGCNAQHCKLSERAHGGLLAGRCQTSLADITPQGGIRRPNPLLHPTFFGSAGPLFPHQHVLQLWRPGHGGQGAGGCSQHVSG